MSFWMSGVVCCVLNADEYAGGEVERNRLVDSLNELPIFDYDPTGVVAGRDSLGPITDLDEDQYKIFIEILNEFCLTGR